MASLKVNYMFLVAMVIVGVVVFSNQASAQDCGADLSLISSKCMAYVSNQGPNVPPSGECCDAIKQVDVPCACKYLTRDIEAMVNMNKVVYAARTCGKPLPPPGYKCGSYTVPNA